MKGERHLTTIIKSPRRLLEEYIGYTPRGPRVGDSNKFHIGDHVVDTGDERHVGEVRGVSSSVWITVRWLDTGWHSEVNAKRLRKVEKERD